MNDAHDRKQPATKPVRKAPSSTGHDGEEGDSPTEEPHEPRVCVPCHGTGKVISNLGDHTRKVVCPWCRGSGERLTGADAQEWQQEQAALKRH
jgi:DnaJ-class molecular chaperone